MPRLKKLMTSLELKFGNILGKLELIEQGENPLTFVLHFCAWDDGEQGIPNAFALPSGDIILTDKFVELSENQDEIDSVLLHEMGHVAHRHSLKMIVQSTLATTVVVVAVGDVNSLADMELGLGSLLLSSNYSRNFESEADQYAFDHMLEIDIDPISFANIMRRITDYSEKITFNKEDEEGADSPVSELTEEEKPNLLDCFSTRPATEKRAQQAERYSKCYAEGLSVGN